MHECCFTFAGLKCVPAGRLPTLAKHRPDLAAALDPNSPINAGLDASAEPVGSQRQAAWRCHCCDCDAPHVWQSSIANRVNGASDCPVCTGKHICRCKSLAALEPALAAEWNHELNGRLQPEDMQLDGRRRVWWSCSEGEHLPFEASVNGRVLHGDGCPGCLGPQSHVSVWRAPRRQTRGWKPKQFRQKVFRRP